MNIEVDWVQIYYQGPLPLGRGLLGGEGTRRAARVETAESASRIPGTSHRIRKKT